MTAPDAVPANNIYARLRDLIAERKYSVMLDDGRMEDALLTVDVLRILDEPQPPTFEDSYFDK